MLDIIKIGIRDHKTNINHNIDREGLWLTTYTCRPVTTQESQAYWVLGTSDLDTETRLA